MSRGPDSGTLLVRALYRDSCRADCPVQIVESDWVRWASATFTGARHTITCTAPPSPALDRWLAGLPEADLLLRGHLVADIVVAGLTRTENSLKIELEALTIEE